MNKDNINLGLYFTEVDREKRLVRGFATLDNSDNHNDTIVASASREAFAEFAGGLREMHQKVAVGPLIQYSEDYKYDPKTDRVYEGIYITARVSEGAEDTWKKVLDGTLRGFSIGGKVIKRGTAYDERGNPFSTIEKYKLNEISLVDNPANPLATVGTIIKSDDGDMADPLYNILLHEITGEVIISMEGSRSGYQHIGWTDNPNDTLKIRDVIDSHHADTAKEDVILLNSDSDGMVASEHTQNNEGGAIVGKITDKDQIEKSGDGNGDEDVVDATETDGEDTTDVDAVTSEDVEADNSGGEEVERAADVDEVSDVVDEAAEIRSIVEDAITKFGDTVDRASALVGNTKEEFEATATRLDKKVSTLEDTIKKMFDDVGKRVADLESDTAFKKSADTDEVSGDENDEDNFWRGSGFLDANDLGL